MGYIGPMGRILLLAALAAGVLSPQLTLAQDYRTEVFRQTNAFVGRQGAELKNPIDPRVVAARVIKVLLGIVGTLFLAYTVYAGYLIMASAGDEEKITKGKSTLRTAIIGVVVTVSAYSLTALITRALLSTQEDQSGFRFEAGIQDAGERQYRQRNDPFADDSPLSPVNNPAN